MSLRDRFKRFREDWDAAARRLEEMEAQREHRNRRAAAEKARRVAEGECDQTWCSNTASRNGKCDGCWSAIFGSIQ